MRKIDIKIYSGGYIECYSRDCPFKKECTNHSSAGDFRTEWGMRPDIRNIDKSELSQPFAMCYTEQETVTSGRCLLISEVVIENDYDI